MKEAVKKHLNILLKNNKFKEVLPEPPILAFCRHKNLKDFLWTKTIANNKTQKVKLSNRKGNSITCYSRTRNVCCTQVKYKNTFSRQSPKGHTTSTTSTHRARDNIPASQKQHSTLGQISTVMNDLYKTTNSPEAGQHFRLPNHNLN